MKNGFAILLFLLISFKVYSQKNKREVIQGIILSDSLRIENVHVINKTTLKGAYTNKKGTFSLPIKIGDILYISHINYDIKEIVITQNSFKNKTINIQIESKTYALEEVILKKKRSIFYVDPEIMPNAVLNATKLKLPFTNTAPTEDKSTLKLRSGVSVNLVSFINVLNGNRKKEKELKKAKLRDQKIEKLRTKFSNSFFYHQLKIQKGYINQFLEYCVQEGVFQYKEKGNILKLTQFLIKKSKTYIHQKLDESILLTKK